MKNTLHVLSLSERAGLEVMFLNYIKFMATASPEKLKYQYVMSFGISDYFSEELTKLGVTIYNVDRKKTNDAHIVRNMMGIIKQHQINIVYGENFIGNFYGAIAKALNKKIRFVAHEHGTAWTTKRYRYSLTKFWIKKSDVIICNSKATSILLHKKFKAPQEKLKIIHNGIPSRKKQVTFKDKYKLIFVGRLDKIKSPHTLLEVMLKLSEFNSKFHIDIFGDGPEYNNLIDQVKKNGLEKKMKIHGNVKDLDSYMAQASWLVLPSIRESFGNVIIEAAFYNIPTVGTNVDGIPEVIDDGYTGYLVPPRKRLYSKVPVNYVVDRKTEALTKPLSPSGNDIADKIIASYNNENSSILMGERAFEKATKLFNIERYYNEIEAVLNVD